MAPDLTIVVKDLSQAIHMVQLKVSHITKLPTVTCATVPALTAGGELAFAMMARAWAFDIAGAAGPGAAGPMFGVSAARQC